MNFDTETAAQYAAEKLDSMLERAERDTAAAIGGNDIPTAVGHFAKLRDAVRGLQDKMTLLQKHIDMMSQELLPTLFGNQDVKTIKIDNIGTVTINDRWTASMPDRAKGMEWLRETGNEGLIIETVSAQTLGAFAKELALKGDPLPGEVFKVTAVPYVSIRQR